MPKSEHDSKTEPQIVLTVLAELRYVVVRLNEPDRHDGIKVNIDPAAGSQGDRIFMITKIRYIRAQAAVKASGANQDMSKRRQFHSLAIGKLGPDQERAELIIDRQTERPKLLAQINCNP